MEVFEIFLETFEILAGSIVVGLILGFTLRYIINRKNKKAMLLAKEKNYIGAIQLLYELENSRLPISKIDISGIHLSLACIYLIISNDEQFLENINKVTYKKHLTLISFWKALYYLEKNDLANYQKSKEDIYKNFNLNNKMKIEDSNVLNRYLYILKSIEEKDNPEREDILNEIVHQQNEKRGFLLKDYLSKIINKEEIDI